jgi:hypothetical protein
LPAIATLKPSESADLWLNSAEMFVSLQKHSILVRHIDKQQCSKASILIG